MGKLQHYRALPGITGLLMLGMLLNSEVLAATTDKPSVKLTIPVTLTNIQATCDLTFSRKGLGSNGGTYTLEELVRGASRPHPAFIATITCQGAGVGSGSEPVKTALVASPRGVTTRDDVIRMLVDGQQNEKGPELWLETGGKRVPMDGSTPFCTGTSMALNECELTPHTRVPDDVTPGNVSATVAFDITYV